MTYNSDLAGYSREHILVLDYGSQYTFLIARRLRENGAFSIVGDDLTPKTRAVVISGSPESVNSPNAPMPDLKLLNAGIPILGICYGFQALSKLLGGSVEPSEHPEFGPTRVKVIEQGVILKGFPSRFTAWMSHSDEVKSPPPDARVLAVSENGQIAAWEIPQRKLFAVQFHPEVSHTEHGGQLFKNFVEFVGLDEKWDLSRFIAEKKDWVRGMVNGNPALLALSGGVDSGVLAYFLRDALGEKLVYPVFVDTGLLKKGEAQRIKRLFGDFRNLKVIDAASEFLNALRGKENPSEKRKIIGSLFIEVFSRHARGFRFLGQGTLYPDVVESGATTSKTSVIKLHHNVGGLPEKMGFELVEPFRELFKDEVREIGRLLGVPEEIISRQPFPGPGFAVRIEGEVTPEKVELLREVDWIVERFAQDSGVYEQTWQIFPILPSCMSTGVKGDVGVFGKVIVLRAVSSFDGMTARPYKLPDEFVQRVVQELTAIPNIVRVLIDVTPKPPGTIEFF